MLFLAITPQNILNLTNQARKSAGLPEYRMNEQLNRAAQAKGQDMAAKGYFSHADSAGKRGYSFIPDFGYGYQSAGENLGEGFDDAEKLQQAWMNSPTHKANILNQKFQDIGIAVVPAVYQGRKTNFFVQLIAEPKAKTIATPTTPAPALQQKPQPPPRQIKDTPLTNPSPRNRMLTDPWYA